jgi:hypothetical protein
MPEPSETPPQPKKRMHGCLIALLVMLGCGIAGTVIVAIVAYRFASTPTGQRVVHLVSDSAKIMYKAQSAPGASEVRKAGNCDQAFVVAGDDVATLARDATDSGVRHAPILVTCQVGVFWEAPACELLARTYVDAAHPKQRFVVNVKKTGSLGSACQETFEADGSPVPAP